jgi:hypothetical protein
MPTGRLPGWEHQLYSLEELTQIRRILLRYARSLPPGSERNKRRWVELKLRALLKDQHWVEANTSRPAKARRRAIAA